jgi:hypothetical protein
VHRSNRNRLLALFVVGVFIPAAAASADTLARCGQGWLESLDDCLIVHLRGSAYEMGYQHGALLRQHIRQNIHYLLEVKGTTSVKIGPLALSPRAAISTIARYQKDHVPKEYLEELSGVSAGSGVPLADIRMANFIPELFHCSGFAMMNSATSDGTLYHGRVLDYAVDWRLQEHAVLIVAEPDGGVPFVNVSYAGFIGSVTGMNAEHVSIGEMGGGGQGHWDGVPMAVLVREVLQRAHNLDEAISVFRDQKRTCQYFYVIADGNTNRAIGMEASWNKLELVQPGEANPLLPKPVKDAVLLSAGKRYDELVRRAEQAHGTVDAEGARRLMDCPVAMKSNLHDVLFGILRVVTPGLLAQPA